MRPAVVCALFAASAAGCSEAAPPYPPSPVIAGARFAPPESVVCRAGGSDNWPITWADDDLLYTAYGDGRGFQPRIERRVSLGFASVAGGPDDFVGTNIRSESGEREGDGAAGPKASGMLSIDGVLYAWVRNQANARLAWSTDRGRSWTWGFQLSESFGSPSFLNYGREYAGARDDYVYTYSQDGPSAYASDDGVVLARVHRARIRERGAWQFFAGTGASGEPRWSGAIGERVPVFRHPGSCRRVEVIHHPGLDRYLMALGFDHAGGWGLFDAPEPWGPWTTAFYTADWGLGRTHSYRLPTKWIEPRTGDLQLVFSGKRHAGVDYDGFCVRGLTLLPRQGPQAALDRGRGRVATGSSTLPRTRAEVHAGRWPGR